MNFTFFKKIIGILLIVVGLAALFTPLTPGSWLVFVGAEMAGIGILSRGNVLKYYERLRRWWKGEKSSVDV